MLNQPTGAPVAVYKNLQVDPLVAKGLAVLFVGLSLWRIVRDLAEKEFGLAGLALVEGVVFGLILYKSWLALGHRFELTIDGFFVCISNRGRRARPLSEITRILFTRDGNGYQIEFRDGGCYKFPLSARSFIDAVSHASKVYVVAA